MARPKAKELTERELEVMHVFWDHERSATDDDDGLEVAEVREELSRRGRELAHTTVATIVKILLEKGFLRQTRDERPYRYQAARSFQDVSGSLVGELVEKVFGGSREALLVQLLGSRKLNKRERQRLEEILREDRR